MRGATVGGNLRAIGHAIVPDHAGNPQSIVGEYFRAAERLERAAESKFAECKAGAERASEGALPGFPSHRWELRVAREELLPLRKLSRLRFIVTGPEGPVLGWSELRDSVESAP